MKSIDKETKGTLQNVRIAYMGSFGLSLFFALLFYVVLAYDGSGVAANFDFDLFKYLVSVSTLTAALLIMEIYNLSPKIMYFKYAIVIALVVMIGVCISELSKGADEALDGSGDRDIEWTYASLSIGFAGIGALIAVLHLLNTHSYLK